MLVVKVQFLYVIHKFDYPEHNGTDINRPVCVQVGLLICLPKVAKMVCRESKHDAVLLLSVYTRLT